ncbi:MAG: PorV/PorQ family protein [Elusimicrobia bacterium]|nr:PorV/PorQ family protein [Elusimicrobiota bacterium]
MRQKNGLKKAFFILIFAASSAFTESPAPYNSYDGINPGIRSAAMGGAGVSFSKDASSIYFNPAALFGGKRKSLFSFKVKESPAEISKDITGGRSLIFLGFQSNGSGLGWQILSNMRISSATETTEVKVNRFAMGFSNKVGSQMTFGMNINFFNGFLGHSDTASSSVKISDGNGWGIDWGLLYRPQPALAMGIAFFNAPASIRWSGYGSEKPPFVTRIGSSLKLPGLFLVSAEAETRKYRKPRDYDGKKQIEIYRLGFEQSFFNVIFLRGGIFGEDLNDKKRTGYTAGIGWSKGEADFDVAWKGEYPTPSSEKYLNTIFISVQVPF